MKKEAVFIDTDLDFDDYSAILYALSDKNIEIAGISVTGCGAVYRKNGINYIARLLEITKRTDIPIFLGADAPLRSTNLFPHSIRAGANVAYEIQDLLIASRISNFGCAIEGLRDIIGNSDTKVTIVLLGGGSTFGQYLKKGYCINNINKIIFSGGNLLTNDLPCKYKKYGRGGNIAQSFGKENPIYSNNVAEYNIFIDVHAAELILKSGIHTSFIPLVASECNVNIGNRKLIEKIKKIDSLSARIISQTFDYTRRNENSNIAIFDVIAIIAGIYEYLTIESITGTSAHIEQKFSSGEEDYSGRITFDENTKGSADFLLKLDGNLVEKLYIEAIKSL